MMDRKCYAQFLGDCNGSLSREHYISKSFLQLSPNGLEISGFPWQEPDKKMSVGIKTLTSRVLCQYHNNSLSYLDNTGKEFLSILQKVFSGFQYNSLTGHNSESLDGNHLELWLLKVLCGLVVVNTKYSIPRIWIDLLFKKSSFPEHSGLYFFGAPGQATWIPNLITVISLKNKNGQIAGAKFGIGGLALLLAFGKPHFEDQEMQALYRPEKIIFQDEEKSTTIHLYGDNYIGHGSVNLKIGSFSSDPEKIFRPIV